MGTTLQLSKAAEHCLILSETSFNSLSLTCASFPNLNKFPYNPPKYYL